MKQIILAIFLTLFLNISCLPLWTECGYGGFVRTLFNKEARLDLLYSGEITREEPCEYKVTPSLHPSSWFHEPINVHRANLSLRARGKWQKLSLQLKVRRDGNIMMCVRGPQVCDEYGRPYRVLIDWRNLKINGKVVFNEIKTLWCQRVAYKHISVKKDETLHIEAEFRRHHFTIHDFTWLGSGSLWYLITGNLFFFFLTYRLFSWVRGGGIRSIDALFLAIFFPMLFIPMIGISDAVMSTRESRLLAVKPVLRDILNEKSDYARRYENWFNEHFCGRVSLIKIHDVIQNKLSRIIHTKKAIYFKENKWEFLLPLVSDLDCRPVFIQSIVQNLVQLNEFCRQNNIKFYVLDVPQKEIIYKKLLDEKYGFDEKTLTKVLQAREAIRIGAKKHHIPYVYPYDELRDAVKNDFVFFKLTHHWTDWGAFVGYRALMKEVSRDFPDMPVVSLNDYWKSKNWLIRDTYYDGFSTYNTWRQLYQYFNIEGEDDPLNRTLYNYYDHKNCDKMVVKVGKFTKDFTYPGGKRKLMLVGTSQNEVLNHFLPFSAAQTKYISLIQNPKNGDQFKIIKLYKKDILDFKPDILVLSIGSVDLPRLRDLSSTK